MKNLEGVSHDKQIRVENRKQQVSPDEVFNQVRDDKQKRLSNDRGRYSRKGHNGAENVDQDHNFRK